MSYAAAREPASGSAVEVVIDSESWAKAPQAEQVVCNAVQTAARYASGLGSLAVLLTDDASIRALNARFRKIDKATNVLSFPSDPAQTGHIGDIAIAYETVAREAAGEQKAFLDQLAHLAVHGYLHLAGFDHETEEEAQGMEDLERSILASLGIADPYAERDAR